MTIKTTDKPLDAVLVGAGIMSATMGTFLQLLQPKWRMEIFERLDRVGAESSEAWNNAGTGHAAFCELNYTKEKPDGSVDCKKAFQIVQQFEQSMQFWAYATEQGLLQDPANFIRQVPHISFVRGEEDVRFLRKRYDNLSKSPLFEDMQYAEDATQLSQWMPLVMDGRDPMEKTAATYMAQGTDVNFGALTKAMFAFLAQSEGTRLHLQHEVEDIRRDPSGKYWQLTITDTANDVKRVVLAKFVFLGAGGGALELLKDSDIPESVGYGGFPVSGRWLRCTNESIIAKHQAKVYGKASVGAPPMSVPHLDSRVIEGKKELLFGPFAGFSTKFLKHGSYFDLPKSIDSDNIVPMLEAGWDNIPLTKYLIQQIMQSDEDRLEELRVYYPEARMEDWELKIAGQRVQVIKDDPDKGGTLEFGTEVVHDRAGTLAGLLGASPGASTAVSVVLEILDKCFHKQMTTAKWQKKLKAIVPSYGVDMEKDEILCKRMRMWTGRVLGITKS